MEKLIEAIKDIAIKANGSTEPMGFLNGVVISVSPLEILCGQKLILNEERLLLSENVRRISVKCSVTWQTESNDPHSHGISGEKEIILDKSLKQGDTVLMIKMQGGQKFYVLEKVVE